MEKIGRDWGRSRPKNHHEQDGALGASNVEHIFLDVAISHLL